ncbi:alpha/beta fold hydrolase [Actinoallomurus bryophytorum]|uniref:Serine aminopeptidase S33 family n=1 Tax=Actinoallomurus bryophytorum TaxID=1490222 RepID=A0A543CV27_9ACTN|nr:serine aminopeptidase S33 family [Actinoallomurus bryophytorum]
MDDVWPYLRRRVVAVLLAVVFAVAGTVGLATADRGIERRSAVVDGVPLEVSRPANATGRLPAVVVAHGLAASRQLMRGFADTLTRRGYAVELVDLTGHGASTRRLPGAGDGQAAEARLDRDLDVAVGHLRAMPWVDGERIGLIGHSMGAAAVVRYATAHPAILATVAISQGPMELTASASRPRDLLLLAGGLEFAGYRDGAAGALRAAYPQGRMGVTYGDPRAGTARRAVLVGGVEHVGVLFSPRTHREVGAWLDASLDHPASGSPGIHPVQRAASAMLLHAAALLSFGAIASAVLGRPSGPEREGRRVPLPLALGVPAVAVVVAVVVMGLIPRGWLPLAVAGPVAGFFGVIGVIGLAAVRLTGRRPGSSYRDGRSRIVAAVVLVALTVVSFAVPAQLGWAHAVPVGPRAWALIPIVACAAVFFGGVEALCDGYGPLAATAIHAWIAAGALAGLCAAVLLGTASSFVLLVAPLLAALLVWQGVQASALRALRAPAWLTAVVGGVLLAWPIAVTMPIA